MKRVLVTGATGFIGRHVLGPLVDRGFEVVAVSRSVLHDRDERVRWIAADLLQPGEPARVVHAARPDQVLHCAWYAEHGKFWHAAENFEWVQATLSLAAAFADAGGRRFVGAGSCAEYDWSEGTCDENATPLEPATPYGVSKAATFRLLRARAEVSPFTFAWGRVFHLFGENENPARLVPSVICALLREQPALCGNGEQLRDFLHVRDVGAALVALLDSDVVGGVNIGSSKRVTVADIVTYIGRSLNRPELVHLGAVPSRAGDPRTLVPETRRLSEEVRWTPQIDLHTALDETMTWWRTRIGSDASALPAPR